MKKIKRFCMVSVFSLLLTTTAFAGDIDTPKAPPPPTGASSATMPGDIHTGSDIENTRAMSDSLTDIALNLLQTMLSVF